MSLALPVLTVALVIAASLLRYVRSATQDVLGSDYLRTARALGASFPEALCPARHPQWRGAGDLDPRHRAGDQFSRRGGGRKSVFSLPGLGSMLLLAIGSATIPMCRACCSFRRSWCC